MTTLTIPAPVVGLLRSALRFALGTAASLLDDASLTSDAAMTKALHRFDDLRAAWEAAAEGPIDMETHGEAVMAALTERHCNETHLRDTANVEEDQRKAEEEIRKIEDLIDRVRLAGLPRAEKSIVLQLTRDDHTEQWSREELGRELYDVEPSAIDIALPRLWGEGVVNRGEEDQAWTASRSTRHLDALGMVSI